MKCCHKRPADLFATGVISPREKRISPASYYTLKYTRDDLVHG